MSLKKNILKLNPKPKLIVFWPLPLTCFIRAAMSGLPCSPLCFVLPFSACICYVKKKEEKGIGACTRKKQASEAKAEYYIS